MSSILLCSLFIFGPHIIFQISLHDSTDGNKIKAPTTEWSTTGTALNDWAIIIVY